MEFEFIINGGFDVVVKALSSIALIFSDIGYKNVFWSIATLGLGMSVLSYYLNALISGGTMRLGPYEWFKSYWWAIFFYFLLIFPVGTLHVYDQHTNRYQPVPGLPLGVVVIAGSLNRIEMGLSDIVDTAMAPLISYKDGGSGQGMDMMREVYSFVDRDMKFLDEYDKMTLDSFTLNCYIFAFLSGDISKNAFMNDQDILNTTFAQANYLSVFSIVYSEGNKTGVTKTCQDAYTVDIKPTLNAAYFNNILDTQFCPKMGYDATKPLELIQCKAVMLDHFTTIGGYSGTNAGFILSQEYISQYINNLMLDGDKVKLAQFVGQREAAAGMAGIGIMANEFIPIFRSVMLAIAFAMTPILFLFMATFAIEAFGYYLGMLTWLMVWGVMDVILHTFAVNYSYDIFTSLRTGGISFNNIFSFDSYAMQVMNVMGYMRVLGVMLSSSIVFGIMKFGGEALSRAASSMQGQIEGAGKVSGKAGFTAEGRSNYQEGLDNGIGTQRKMSHFSPMQRQNADTFSKVKSTQSALTEMGNLGDGSAIGGGTTSGTAGGYDAAIRAQSTNSFVKGVEKNTGLNTKEAVKHIGRIAGGGKSGETKGYDNSAKGQIASQQDVSSSSVGYLNRQMDRFNRGEIDREEFLANSVGSNANPDTRKLANAYGLNEQSSRDDIKDTGNRLKGDIGKASEEISSGMKELGVYDGSAKMKQANLAAESLGMMNDYDGDGKISDGERGLGVAKFMQASNAKGEVTLDKDSADHLSKTTGVNFNAGDRVRFGQNPDTGEMTMAKAEGGFSGKVTNGKVTEGNYGKQELGELADRLKDNGHLLSAAYVKDQLMPSMGDNETAKVSLNQDNQGNLSTARIEHGSEVEHFDEAEREQEMELDGYKNTQGWQDKQGKTWMPTGGKLKQIGEGDNAYTQYRGNIQGPDGKGYTGTIDVGRNGKAMNVDAKRMVSTATGSSNVDQFTDKTVRDTGYNVNDSTMRAFASPDASPELQKTIAGDLYDGETGEINNEAGIAQAQATTKNLNQIVKDSGTTASSAEVTGSGELQFSGGTPGAAELIAGIKVKAGARVAAGFQRYSKKISDQSLHYGVDRRLQEKAQEVATINGKFNPKIAADYLHKGRQEMQELTDARAKGQTEFSFGTTSVIAPLLKGAVQDSKNVRDQILNMGKEENDNSEFFKGLEGKSPEEIDKAMAERFGDYNSDQYLNMN